MLPNTQAWILGCKPTDNWNTFIRFWQGMYNYSSKSKAYNTYVVERKAPFEFDRTNLRSLFEWKNNTEDELSGKKSASVTKMTNELPLLNKLRQEWSDDDFNKAFGHISAVWQVFLMHIVQPDRYPIFDQHVYRAFIYLQTGKTSELTGTTKKKLSVYTAYKAFFEEIRLASSCTPHEIDKALWAFGRFVKQYHLDQATHQLSIHER